MTFDQTGPQPREQLLDTVRAALDAGVTLFDTADAYGPGQELGPDAQGENEKLIASILDELGVRDRVLLATKGGAFRTEGGGWDHDGRPEHLHRAVDASLPAARRRADRAVAAPPPRPGDRLRRDHRHADRDRCRGKVRMIGLSNADPDQIRRGARGAGRRPGQRAEPVQPEVPQQPARDRRVRRARPGLPALEPARRPVGRQGAGRPPPGLPAGRRRARRQRPAGRAGLGAGPVARGHPDPGSQAAAVDPRLRRGRRPRADPGRAGPSRRE